MKYYFKKIKNYRNPVPLYFLCGVKYNKKNPNDDKRVVLKNYLYSKGCSCIILEQNFAVKKENGKLSYDFINLKNLNDVETLACMAVDGIVIIHESHSTAAEIALFASNESVAKKIFVLVPDEENSGTNHFSGFLKLGYKDLVYGYTIFYPVTETYVVNQTNTKVKTYFNNNRIDKNLTSKIDEFIEKSYKTKSLDIKKCDYHEFHNESISYYIEDNKKICISIDVEVLRYYIISIFSISKFRSEIRETKNFFESVKVCRKWFERILLDTIQLDENIDISKLRCKFELSNSINMRLNLNKAISFILYIFHAIGWIEIDKSNNKGISISRKTATYGGFKSIYSKYKNIIYEEHLFDFERIPS